MIPAVKDFKELTILVTGAAGYIGSHFVRHFLAEAGENARLVAVDNLSYGHREALPDDQRLTFVEASIGDQAAMRKVFAGHKIDAVVHFAAFIAVAESETDPLKYFRNNVCDTINLFSVMDEFDVRRVVFSSTCAVYGVPEYVPLDENHRRSPFSVYGLTKSMVEDVLESMVRTKGWSYVALRYFNCAGADESGEIGEAHEPETHLIPNLLKGASANREVEIFGQDYETRDGTCVRDYIHVNDLASAHGLALRYLQNNEGGIAINLGTTIGSTNLEVIAVCEQVTGQTIPLKMVPRRAGDVPTYVAGGDRAKSVLGWSATRDLTNIVSSAWRWQSSKRY